MKDKARITEIDSSLSEQNSKAIESQTVHYTRSGAVDTEYYMRNARRLRVEALRTINVAINDEVVTILRIVTTSATWLQVIAWIVQGKWKNNRSPRTHR